MSDLVRDYLALPEVRFLAEHWRALGALFLTAVAVALLIGRRR